MSLNGYPSYRNVPVEWLREVPAHWNVVRNKTLMREVDERHDTGDGELMTVSHLTGVTRRSEKNVNMIMAESLEGYKRAQRDDLVINTMWAWMGALGVSPCDGLFSPSYNVYRFVGERRLVPAYYDLLCRTQAHVAQIRANSTGIWESRLRLYPDVFLGMSVCVPPVDEQHAIVSFLRRECAKVDDLVSAQERLLELIAEKREALISAAVSGSMAGDARESSSGEWHGAYPAHWSIRPLAQVAEWDKGLFIDGDWIESKDLSTEGIRYLTTGNVGSGKFKDQGDGFISPGKFVELQCTEVHPGDILISRLNLPIARSCVVPDLGSRLVTSVDNVICRPSPDYDPRFLVYMLSSRQHFANTENLARGTTMQRISRTRLGRIRFPMPPLSEQRAIADRLDGETGKLDGLTDDVEKAIVLLRARRAGLIEAAVTGRIDVRHLAAALGKPAVDTPIEEIL